ncbi:MAG TPA: long-chain fatty acid--CoA ligase, partial [Acidimicrobiia bacterium]|nr:long-chain fatty acid--CoA ligase [Acidimicrobiia bacterium]
HHANQGGGPVAFETIPHLVLANGSRLGSAPAYFTRGAGGWEATSWSGYAAEVRRAGAALIGLGVEPGQVVAILGANRPEWVIADVGAMAAGAVPAGIYATSSPAECEYILNHSEAPVAVVENIAQWQKIEAVRHELPHLRHVVLMGGAPAVDDPLVLSWDGFLARGDGGGSALDDRLAELQPSAVGTFIYTSGTTGRPKAVMLTHDNMTWTAAQACDLAGGSQTDRLVSYLPLSHVAEQMFTIHIAAVAGYPVYYAESIDKLNENLVEVQPTLFFGVPRVWEKFHAGVVEKLAENHGLKAKLIEEATAVGRRVVGQRAEGRSPSVVDAARFALFDKLVYSKVKAGLGLGRARLCVSGAAPVSVEVLEFFAGFGVPVYEVYGQSEDCGPTSFNVPGRTRFGTVGPAFPGVEVKIGGDGEILVRGRNVFAGYFKDPEATAETLADGWLHTGDLGEFDAAGYLSITGRKKDIIITAGGKNVAPSLLEGGLRNHPLVSEAVVIGDRRKFLSVLVTLDAESLARYARDHGLADRPEESVELRGEIQRAIDDVNQHLARVEQIKKFTILPRELSMAEGELTPTLKVKRNVVTAHFEAEIEAMYTD